MVNSHEKLTNTTINFVHTNNILQQHRQYVALQHHTIITTGTNTLFYCVCIPIVMLDLKATFPGHRTTVEIDNLSKFPGSKQKQM